MAISKNRIALVIAMLASTIMHTAYCGEKKRMVEYHKISAAYLKQRNTIDTYISLPTPLKQSNINSIRGAIEKIETIDQNLSYIIYYKNILDVSNFARVYDQNRSAKAYTSMDEQLYQSPENYTDVEIIAFSNLQETINAYLESEALQKFRNQQFTNPQHIESTIYARTPIALIKTLLNKYMYDSNATEATLAQGLRIIRPHLEISCNSHENESKEFMSEYQAVLQNAHYKLSNKLKYLQRPTGIVSLNSQNPNLDSIELPIQAEEPLTPLSTTVEKPTIINSIDQGNRKPADITITDPERFQPKNNTVNPQTTHNFSSQKPIKIHVNMNTQATFTIDSSATLTTDITEDDNTLGLDFDQLTDMSNSSSSSQSSSSATGSEPAVLNSNSAMTTTSVPTQKSKSIFGIPTIVTSTIFNWTLSQPNS